MLGLLFLTLIQLVTAIPYRLDDSSIYTKRYHGSSKLTDGDSPPADPCGAENGTCNSATVDLTPVPTLGYKAAEHEDYPPYANARDLMLLSQLIEVRATESQEFNPDKVIFEWAAKVGIDLNDEPTVPQVPPIPEKPPATAVGRRIVLDSWAERARKSGEEAYLASWQLWVTTLGKATDTVAIAQQPQLCTQLTSSTVDGCKKGVRAQAAYCKQALRDKIANCKDNVGRWVDRCKKDKKWIPGGSPWCEAQRFPKTLGCEGQRLDIPFCELNRLTAGCCEGTRPQLQGMCAAGLSPAKLQEQSQKVQAICSIAAALAKSAIKSYLSGQALGILNDLQSVKQLGQTVQVIKNIQATRAKYETWANGLTAAAEGRLAEAQKSLGSLASEISPSINNAVAWSAAAEAAVSRNVDKFLADAANAAGEIDQIKIAKANIGKLQAVANDINAIQTAAIECAKVPTRITPDEYAGWKTVSSWETLRAAVEEYKQVYGQTLFQAARCRAVVNRAGRLFRS